MILLKSQENYRQRRNQQMIFKSVFYFVNLQAGNFRIFINNLLDISNYKKTNLFRGCFIMA